MMNKNRALSALVGFQVETECSFQEVLAFVNKRTFPMAWNEVLKIKTVTPTTVCCEQSFSVIKHTLHKNMANKTLTAKVTTKYHEKVEREQI